MSNPIQHPDELDLLRYADGELAPRQTRQVRDHLATCWQCRTALDELQSTIGECVRYRTNVLCQYLPPQPAPWMDIHAAFSRLDAAGRVSFFARLGENWRQASRWAIPAAVAAAVLLMAVVKLRQTPAVQAAELLHKAVASEKARPASARRIQIRTRKRNLIRAVGVDVGAKAPADAELAPLFLAARYDWQDPLSAHAFDSWRGQLRDKQDQVSETGGQYVIRTSTPDGDLAVASLTLRHDDLQPVSGRLEFRDNEWVEMSEVPADTALPQQTTAGSSDTPATVAVAPAPAAVPSAPAGPGTAEELQVMAALHQLGADLGEPVEVNRSGRGIVVSGAGIAPERQDQIRAALRPIPGVEVRFAEGGTAPAADVPAGTIAPPPADTRLQARLEQKLGGRAQFEQFSSRLIDLSEEVMSRAYAVRRLAQQFPAASLAGSGAAERATLVRLGGEHAAALDHAGAAMEQMLHPVLGSASVPRSTGAGVWQAAAEELFQKSRRTETLLTAMLDVSPRNGSGDSFTELLTALAEMRAAAAHFQQALSQLAQ